MSPCSLVAQHFRPFAARAVAATATLAALLAATSAGAGAQTTLTACTQGALRNCAELRLTATPGAGAGGQTLLEIAVRNAGSLATPALPTSLYNLVLGTGGPPFAPGGEVAGAPTPVAVGGATITDATPWDLFDSGDALFLSSLTNFGVGGCAVGAPVGGFGQAARTCAAGEYVAFRYSTPRAYDPASFTVLNLEVVGLVAGLPGDSYTPSVVPEPSALLLAAPGLLGVAALARRARGRGRPAGVEG